MFARLKEEEKDIVAADMGAGQQNGSAAGIRVDTNMSNRSIGTSKRGQRRIRLRKVNTITLARWNAEEPKRILVISRN